MRLIVLRILPWKHHLQVPLSYCSRYLNVILPLGPKSTAQPLIAWKCPVCKSRDAAVTIKRTSIVGISRLVRVQLYILHVLILLTSTHPFSLPLSPLFSFFLSSSSSSSLCFVLNREHMSKAFPWRCTKPDFRSKKRRNPSGSRHRHHFVRCVTSGITSSPPRLAHHMQCAHGYIITHHGYESTRLLKNACSLFRIPWRNEKQLKKKKKKHSPYHTIYV
ncbi:hypothetical protein V8C37DRAFT_381719, partial [Trichoderma ceciliae]